MEQLYKIVAQDGSACHGGKGEWPLPWEGIHGTVGEWLPPIKKLIPCKQGYHLLKKSNIPIWLKLDCVLYEASFVGAIIYQSDKVVVEQARLLRKVGVLTKEVLVEFAILCAKRVYKDKVWNKWADDWLSGVNRSNKAANAAYAAAYAAANAAANTAANAAYAAANAAYAAAYAAEKEWQGQVLINLLTNIK